MEPELVAYLPLQPKTLSEAQAPQPGRPQSGVTHIIILSNCGAGMQFGMGSKLSGARLGLTS